MRAQTHTQGTDMLEGVIHLESFEGIFWTETVKSVFRMDTIEGAIWSDIVESVAFL